MRKEKDILDGFLQQKVEEATFASSEQDWLKALELLEKDEKDNKKVFPFWKTIIATLLVCLLGVTAFLFTKKKTTNNNSITNTTNTITHTNTATDTIQNTVAAIPEINVATQQATNTTENTNSNNTQHANSQNASNTVASNEEVNTTNNISLQKQTTTNSVSRKHAVKNTISKKEDAIAVDNTTHNNIVDKTSANSTKQTTPKDVNKTSQTTPTNTQTTSTTTTTTTTTRSVKKLEPVDTQYYSNSKQQVFNPKHNPRYNESLINYTQKYDSVIIRLKPKEDVAVNNMSSQKETMQKQADSINTQAINKKMQLYAMLGLHANVGFKNSVSNPVNIGFAPYIGIGVQKQLTSNIGFASHIGFTYMNALNTEENYKSYRYSFGLDSVSTTIKHKKINQIQIPISMYYQIAPKHQLLTSIGINYNVSVLSTVKNEQFETTINSTGLPGSLTTNKVTKTQNTFAYADRFNPLDIFIQVGYSYMLSKKMNIQCVYQYGLLDATNNAMLNNTVSNRQSRLFIGLKYNFIKK